MTDKTNRRWNSRPAVKPTTSANAKANRAAVRKMSDCELWTGRSAEELRAIQLEQKARVMGKAA